MEHNIYNSETFNFLTMNQVKEGLQLTGETKEPIAIGDVVKGIPCDITLEYKISKIIERRDSKDYPKGNGYFYKALLVCVPKQ